MSADRGTLGCQRCFGTSEQHGPTCALKSARAHILHPSSEPPVEGKRTVQDACWRCEGTGCDTHAEECQGVCLTPNCEFCDWRAGACTPCRACAPKPPGAFDSFVAGAVADCVEGRR